MVISLMRTDGYPGGSTRGLTAALGSHPVKRHKTRKQNRLFWSNNDAVDDATLVIPERRLTKIYGAICWRRLSENQSFRQRPQR